jgi:general secretion pathway protein A
VAGASEDIFSPSAADMIHDYTGGIPRLVNQLCDLSMVYAYTKNHKRVLRLTVQQVLDDGVFFAARPPPQPAEPLNLGAELRTTA